MDTLEADLEKLETAMRLFFQTMKRPQHWARVTAAAGVTIDRPATLILHTLAMPRSEGWRVQDLAVQLGIEAPSVTRKTQELELAGYLKRTRNLQDKRAIGLQLTSSGSNINKRIWKAQRQTIAQALSLWPAAERKQFIASFQRFSNDLANQQLSTQHVK